MVFIAETLCTAFMTSILLIFSALVQYQQYEIKNEALSNANEIITNTYICELMKMNLSIDKIESIFPEINISSRCLTNQLCRLVYVKGRILYLR